MIRVSHFIYRKSVKFMLSCHCEQLITAQYISWESERVRTNGARRLQHCAPVQHRHMLVGVVCCCCCFCVFNSNEWIFNYRTLNVAHVWSLKSAKYAGLLYIVCRRHTQKNVCITCKNYVVHSLLSFVNFVSVHWKRSHSKFNTFATM